jgi:hypothetical protein
MGNNKTSFTKGKGGRPKGKPNKITGTLREWISSFIDNNRPQIQKDWKSLDPKDRLIMFERLLKYTLPTLQATTLTVDFEKLTDQQLDEIIERLKNNNDESTTEN